LINLFFLKQEEQGTYGSLAEAILCELQMDSQPWKWKNRLSHLAQSANAIRGTQIDVVGMNKISMPQWKCALSNIEIPIHNTHHGVPFSFVLKFGRLRIARRAAAAHERKLHRKGHSE
jgi:hypothetical protein